MGPDFIAATVGSMVIFEALTVTLRLAVFAERRLVQRIPHFQQKPAPYRCVDRFWIETGSVALLISSPTSDAACCPSFSPRFSVAAMTDC